MILAALAALLKTAAKRVKISVWKENAVRSVFCQGETSFMTKYCPFRTMKQHTENVHMYN